MTKTYSEILDDIVAYYKTNPRGLEHGSDSSCTYTGCAIGYACGFQVDEWDEYGDFWEVLDHEWEDTVWEKFLPQYRKTNVDFWRSVQSLHDTYCNWVENDLGGQDLSEKGKDRVDSLKREYKR
mgnify:FL=1